MSEPALRRLDQPGPPSRHAWRAQACGVAMETARLPSGATLAEALAAAAGAGGSAAFILDDVPVAPLAYNLPSLSDEPQRAAWYAGPFAADGATIETGAVFLGRQDGRPALHCHARWRFADGRAGAGHVLLDRTVLAGEVNVRMARIDGAAFDIQPDAETNFSIFHPVAVSGSGASGALLVKLSPNVDFTRTLEAAAAAHDMPKARIVAAVGSLVGGAFEDAPAVADPITEVFAVEGHIGMHGSAGVPTIAVDPGATVHEGRLRRGANAVGITFEVLLAAD
ncbi:MAG: hypothetical protein RLO50_22760 [Azospirillaceae bacterium]